jgi:prefoldin subunit 5
LLNAKIETVGDKYEDLQQQLIKASGQPNYVFVDGNGKLLVDGGYGYDATKGAKEFIEHLEKVKQVYSSRINDEAVLNVFASGAQSEYSVK